ncbi:uncharacterized protein LOC122246723, partial [Penaeus japonicus]|uniref:uncharacterized protein LOC122246723 n=1 Tax=Penaeus japonicus TaxID=27405 RepID=UPI001C716F4B
MPIVFLPLYSTVLRIPRLRSFLPSSDDRQHWKLRTKSIMWRPRWTQQEAEGPSRGLSGHDLPSYAPARHGYPCFASLHGYTHPYESDEEDSWSEEESEDPIPRFLFSGYVELTTARIYKVMASTGILEVESDLIVGTSARVFFQRNALCLNETRVKSGAPLYDLLRDYLTEPCSCVARPFAKRNGTFRRITGVEVHLIARKVWIGTRSAQPVVSGRHAKTERVIVSKNVERDCSPPACNMQISKAAPQACTIFQGEVLYVEASAGVLEKADGDGAVFYAHQCFLFGVCLRDVHLADVLPK